MRILYVSDDDLCRGPMAVAVSRNHAKRMHADFATFESAGLRAKATLRPPPEIVRYLRGQNCDVSQHVSRPLGMEQVRWADVILCMTHEIARTASARIGEPHSAKIRVLNDLTGFGDTEREMDITGLEKVGTKSLLALYSRIKASTGRLVRDLGDGGDTAAALGIPEVDDSEARRAETDPATRSYLAGCIAQVILRAFEPPTSAQIQEALEAIGQHVPLLLIDDILARELSSQVHRNTEGGWVAGRPEAESPPPGAESPPQDEEKISFTLPEAFAFLALDEKMTLEQAKRIYRKLLLRYHPDKFHDDPEFARLAESKTRRITKAWELVEAALREKE